MKKFGDALKEARKTQRLTLRRISEGIGLSIGYLSDIEQGRRLPPSADIIEQLEKTLHITKGSLSVLAVQAKKIAPRAIAKKIASAPKLSEVLMRADGDLTESEFTELMNLYETIKNKRS